MTFRSGENHPRARLTWDDVELMRALHDEGVPVLAIANKFEVPRRTVRNVVEYNVWRGPPPRQAQR